MCFSAALHASSFDDFFVAVKRNDVPALRQLAQRGFDLNTRNEAGDPALILAIRDGSSAVANYLADEKSVNVEARTAKDESALMMAALKGDVKLAQRLIARQAEVNKTGWTPLHYAATHPGNASVDMVRLMLEHHAYIDAESPNATTPLMMAAQYGQPGVVKLLLEEGADPLLKNQRGMTAIDFAQRAGRAASAEMISAAVRARQPKGKW
ncbi:ankyrin repeat domain-containing protein [Hydrogenophaga sp.]|uniref:ankyrin repeat domain-containing protein n=1 Tax=Hydrogenophaga sp. TaxID=1904254 RepID=UPI002727B103|nr:ankyrin repeat domain-containing protein [Hydrogenophaga sp.]MDO9438828.1 ankyrin repeat domain-containing protein [Hydrogenophaga sp.]